MKDSEINNILQRLESPEDLSLKLEEIKISYRGEKIPVTATAAINILERSYRVGSRTFEMMMQFIDEDTQLTDELTLGKATNLLRIISDSLSKQHGYSQSEKVIRFTRNLTTFLAYLSKYQNPEKEDISSKDLNEIAELLLPSFFFLNPAALCDLEAGNGEGVIRLFAKSGLAVCTPKLLSIALSRMFMSSEISAPVVENVFVELCKVKWLDKISLKQAINFLPFYDRPDADQIYQIVAKLIDVEMPMEESITAIIINALRFSEDSELSLIEKIALISEENKNFVRNRLTQAVIDNGKNRYFPSARLIELYDKFGISLTPEQLLRFIDKVADGEAVKKLLQKFVPDLAAEKKREVLSRMAVSTLLEFGISAAQDGFAKEEYEEEIKKRDQQEIIATAVSQPALLGEAMKFLREAGVVKDQQTAQEFLEKQILARKASLPAVMASIHSLNDLLQLNQNQVLRLLRESFSVADFPSISPDVRFSEESFATEPLDLEALADFLEMLNQKIIRNEFSDFAALQNIFNAVIFKQGPEVQEVVVKKLVGLYQDEEMIRAKNLWGFLAATNLELSSTSAVELIFSFLGKAYASEAVKFCQQHMTSSATETVRIRNWKILLEQPVDLVREILTILAHGNAVFDCDEAEFLLATTGMLAQIRIKFYMVARKEWSEQAQERVMHDIINHMELQECFALHGNFFLGEFDSKIEEVITRHIYENGLGNVIISLSEDGLEYEEILEKLEKFKHLIKFSTSNYDIDFAFEELPEQLRERFAKLVIGSYKEENAVSSIAINPPIVVGEDISLRKFQDVMLVLNYFDALIAEKNLALMLAENPQFIASVNNTIAYYNAKFISHEGYILLCDINDLIPQDQAKINVDELLSFEELLRQKPKCDLSQYVPRPEVEHSALYKALQRKEIKFEDFYNAISWQDREDMQLVRPRPQEFHKVLQWLKEQLPELKKSFSGMENITRAELAKLPQKQQFEIGQQLRAKDLAKEIEKIQLSPNSEITDSLEKTALRDEEEQEEVQFSNSQIIDCLERFMALHNEEQQGKICSEMSSVVRGFWLSFKTITYTANVELYWNQKIIPNLESLREVARLSSSLEEVRSSLGAAFNLIMQPNCSANLAVLLNAQLNEKRYLAKACGDLSTDEEIDLAQKQAAFANALFAAALEFLNQDEDQIGLDTNFEEVMGDEDIYLPKNYFAHLIAEALENITRKTGAESAKQIGKDLKEGEEMSEASETAEAQLQARIAIGIEILSRIEQEALPSSVISSPRSSRISSPENRMASPVMLMMSPS